MERVYSFNSITSSNTVVTCRTVQCKLICTKSPKSKQIHSFHNYLSFYLQLQVMQHEMWQESNESIVELLRNGCLPLLVLHHQSTGGFLNSKASSKQRTPFSCGLMIWRCVNLFMSLFFFFATCAQVNDPDPLLWMVVYVVPSVLSLLLAIHPFLTGNFMWRLACFLHFITSFGFFLYLLVQFARVMDPQFYGINPVNYEKGRELCGVFIIMVWLRLCKEVPISRSILAAL
ncbi:uncharacterized protein LOC143225154 isoform X6 [Tachypleus tridentatus]|uniref:uncharacterized protein LOC143225154 isoform X6 n=2 Tax=Tachypleus tridentatus TaxID=6853 RepID=UPI003FD05EF9